MIASEECSLALQLDTERAVIILEKIVSRKKTSNFSVTLPKVIEDLSNDLVHQEYPLILKL